MAKEKKDPKEPKEEKKLTADERMHKRLAERCKS